MPHKLNRSCNIGCVLAALVPLTGARAQTAMAPIHDARIQIDLALPQHEIQKFYDVYYGHNIRLGEAPYWCGDPKFLVHVNEVPALQVFGQYPSDGNYAAYITASSGLNAKVYEKCLGFDHPSVGGVANVGGSVGPLTNQPNISLTGTFIMGSLMGFPVLTVPLNATIPLPASFLNEIPISLDSPMQMLDFGSLSGGTWVSTGTKKTIPIYTRAGAIGESANGSTSLVVDAIIGSKQSYDSFSNSNEARAAFESDQPALPTENIAVGVKKSFFGSASTDPSQETGFLGQLFPIRVSGQGTYKLLFWKKQISWQAVLDTAAVKYVTHEGKPAIEATVSSHFAMIGKRRIVGKRALKAVAGDVMFDRMRMDQGVLKFRVADFRINVKIWRFFVIPIRLSSGQLEQQLNGGSLPIATAPIQETISLPDSHYSPPCIDTGWDKLKADYGMCNDPGQAIRFLSYEPGYGSGTSSITFTLDPSTFSDPRFVGDEMQMGAQITAAP